mmetsp:Transcript_46327/g.108551  ORF Transcript_46327/g.108551 Transcript_46327/m.108551 type:complete len:245 (+) Transcript_46327:1809-2543(+)
MHLVVHDQHYHCHRQEQAHLEPQLPVEQLQKCLGPIDLPPRADSQASSQAEVANVTQVATDDGQGQHLDILAHFALAHADKGKPDNHRAAEALPQASSDELFGRQAVLSAPEHDVAHHSGQEDQPNILNLADGEQYGRQKRHDNLHDCRTQEVDLDDARHKLHKLALRENDMCVGHQGRHANDQVHHAIDAAGNVILAKVAEETPQGWRDWLEALTSVEELAPRLLGLDGLLPDQVRWHLWRSL